jgi:hypothetical protein
MFVGLRDRLSAEISFDEYFEDVAAVFFLDSLVGPRFELLKGLKLIEDPLFESNTKI